MYIKNQRVKLTERKKEETTVIFYLLFWRFVEQKVWSNIIGCLCRFSCVNHSITVYVQMHIFVYLHLLVFSSIYIFYVYVMRLSRIFFYIFCRISSSQDFNFLKQLNSWQLKHHLFSTVSQFNVKLFWGI